MSKTVVFICEKSVTSDDISMVKNLEGEMDIYFRPMSTTQELLRHLADPNFQIDAALIDIDEFYQDGLGVIALITMFNTLGKYTWCYDEQGKQQRRNAHLAAVVSLDTDPKLIKDFLALTGQECSIITHCYPGYTLEDARLGFTQVLEGKHHVPQIIREKMRAKRHTVKNNATGITLTPREQQILTLIRERGASNKVIAKMLNISESTVKLHIGKVLKKYGVKNRTQLAVFSK